MQARLNSIKSIKDNIKKKVVYNCNTTKLFTLFFKKKFPANNWHINFTNKIN